MEAKREGIASADAAGSAATAPGSRVLVGGVVLGVFIAPQITRSLPVSPSLKAPEER